MPNVFKLDEEVSYIWVEAKPRAKQPKRTAKLTERRTVEATAEGIKVWVQRKLVVTVKEQATAVRYSNPERGQPLPTKPPRELLPEHEAWRLRNEAMEEQRMRLGQVGGALVEATVRKLSYRKKPKKFHLV